MECDLISVVKISVKEKKKKKTTSQEITLE